MTTGLLDTEPEETRDAGDGSARAVTNARDLWRGARVPIVVGLAIIALAVLTAITTGGVTADYLDANAARPPGGRALAELLRARGVDVRVVDRPSFAADTTIFVPVPARLPESTLALAGRADEVVVVSPESEDLETLGARAEVAGADEVRVVDPACTHQDAVAAGRVHLGGLTYGAPEDAVACYAVSGQASFVELTGDGGRRLTLLGSGDFMTNHRLDEEGNAALALRLLGRHRTVEWVYPAFVAAPVEGEEKGLGELLPDRVFVVTLQVFLAVVLLALWRGRRLGPVVIEPLPVVVRAAEAVEGRARLYESAQARERAGEALRAGLRDRLVRALGLAADANRETLLAAVVTRTSTFDDATVDRLLYGPPPADDAALVRLAADLDSLDHEVRSQ